MSWVSATVERAARNVPPRDGRLAFNATVTTVEFRLETWHGGKPSTRGDAGDHGSPTRHMSPVTPP